MFEGTNTSEREKGIKIVDVTVDKGMITEQSQSESHEYAPNFVDKAESF